MNGSNSSPDYAASSIENDINVNKFEGTPKNKTLADESVSSISILQKLNANPMSLTHLAENDDGEISLGARTPMLNFLQNSKIMDRENKNSAKKNFELPEQNSALPKMYNDG